MSQLAPPAPHAGIPASALDKRKLAWGAGAGVGGGPGYAAQPLPAAHVGLTDGVHVRADLGRAEPRPFLSRVARRPGSLPAQVNAAWAGRLAAGHSLKPPGADVRQADFRQCWLWAEREYRALLALRTRPPPPPLFPAAAQGSKIASLSRWAGAAQDHEKIRTREAIDSLKRVWRGLRVAHDARQPRAAPARDRAWQSPRRRSPVAASRYVAPPICAVHPASVHGGAAPPWRVLVLARVGRRGDCDPAIMQSVAGVAQDSECHAVSYSCPDP